MKGNASSFSKGMAEFAISGTAESDRSVS